MLGQETFFLVHLCDDQHQITGNLSQSTNCDTSTFDGNQPVRDRFESSVLSSSSLCWPQKFGDLVSDFEFNSRPAFPPPPPSHLYQNQRNKSEQLHLSKRVFNETEIISPKFWTIHWNKGTWSWSSDLVSLSGIFPWYIVFLWWILFVAIFLLRCFLFFTLSTGLTIIFVAVEFWDAVFKCADAFLLCPYGNFQRSDLFQQATKIYFLQARESETWDKVNTVESIRL